MKTEVLILSAIFIATLCDGFLDRYSQLRAMLRRPGGLGVPLLPPDKRYISEDLLKELQRISSKQLPLLPPDKRHGQEFAFPPNSGRPLPLLPPDKKSRKPRSDPESPTFSKRLMLPDDGAPFRLKSSNEAYEVPFWRTWAKPRRLPMLPPDKKTLYRGQESNAFPNDMFMPLDSSFEGDEFQSAHHRRPLPLLPPDKKSVKGEPFFNQRWVTRSVRPIKQRLIRGDAVVKFLDEKDKAVVGLIESASEVLHNLAEKLKSYNPVDGFPYDDTDLGKRVPLLPFERSDGPVADFDESVAKAIAEEALASSRRERSAGLHYKDLDNSPPRKLPLLPFDKRST